MYIPLTFLTIFAGAEFLVSINEYNRLLNKSYEKTLAPFTTSRRYYMAPGASGTVGYSFGNRVTIIADDDESMKAVYMDKVVFKCIPSFKGNRTLKMMDQDFDLRRFPSESHDNEVTSTIDGPKSKP